MKQFISTLVFATLIFSTPINAGPGASVTTPNIRLKAAQDYLKEQPNLLAIYAKGFICSSCGMGLRIHLTKLAGIDKKQFKRGVLMDASKQLLIVAFQPGSKIDTNAIRKAVDNAGYEPAHYYKWNGQSVDLVKFEEVR